MEAEVIQFIGAEKLTDAEKELANKLANEYYDRIKRSLHNLTSMTVHIKTHSDKGKPDKHGKKYSIHVKALAPTALIESDNADDWNLERTLHKAFKEIEIQISHRFHNDVSNPTKNKRPPVD